MDCLLALSIGILSGALLGAFGGGAGLIAAPGLTVALGLSAVDATSASLIAVLVGACVGALTGGWTGSVRLSWAVGFSVVGLLGATAGSLVSPLLSARATWASLAGVCATTVILVSRDRRSARSPESGIGAITTAPSPHLALIAGLSIGVATGMLGIGGGVFVVPALVAFAGLSLEHATATSLLVIAATSSAALVVRQHAVDSPPSDILFSLALGTAIAVPVGWTLASRLKVRVRWALQRDLIATMGVVCLILAVAS